MAVACGFGHREIPIVARSRPWWRQGWDSNRGSAGNPYDALGLGVGVCPSALPTACGATLPLSCVFNV